MSRVLDYNRLLEQVDFSRNQAELWIKVVSEMLDNKEYATKSDLRLLDERLGRRIDRLDGRIDQVEANLLVKLSAVVVTTGTIMTSICLFALDRYLA